MTKLPRQGGPALTARGTKRNVTGSFFHRDLCSASKNNQISFTVETQPK
jgi:hypothetical protein